MRIIKLQIEVPSKRGGTKVLKQAVCLKKRSHKNIRHFIEYVKNMCGLKQHYGLSIQGFAFSPLDTVEILQQGKIYRLSLSKKKNILPLEPSSSSQLSQSESEEVDSSSQKSEREEVDSSQQISKEQQPMQKAKQRQRKQPQPISKKNNKNSKIKHKQNIQEKESSSEESQSSSFEVRINKNHKPKRDETPKRLPEKKATPIQIPKEVGRKLINTKINPQAKKKVQSESESQDSSSSQELPHIPKKTPVIQKPQITTTKAEPKVQKVKPAVINGDSESQSSPSPEKQPLKKEKSPVTGPNPQLNIQKSNQQPLKIPPALRNVSKPAPRKNFQQHQADQWLPLDKQKLLAWKQRGHKTFCECPNRIRFKVIEFDEQKFIPVKSGWIKGEVSSVEQNGTVHLIDIEQEGTKQFKKEYNIPEHNMDELQIWKPLASKEQLEVLTGDRQQKQPEKSQSAPIPQQKAVQNDSIQKFICGQVNYYFSDRNYSTDFFLQLHANSHPQKYVKLSLMLNFPKIKKVLRDQQKLYQYLKEDEKYFTRNYEINFEERLIRKKDIKDPREMHAQNKSQKNEVIQEKNQPTEAQNVLKKTQIVQQDYIDQSSKLDHKLV